MLISALASQATGGGKAFLAPPNRVRRAFELIVSLADFANTAIHETIAAPPTDLLQRSLGLGLRAE